MRQLVLPVLLAGTLVAGGVRSLAEEPAPARRVLVELFTSQG